jgi:hypothetical protein
MFGLTKDEAETLFALVSTVALIVGGMWAFVRFVLHWELFPRINMSVGVNFVGRLEAGWMVEVIARVTNSGMVPHTVTALDFELRGIKYDDELIDGSPAIREQLYFKNLIREKSWITAEKQKHMRLMPKVTLRYNYVTMIPDSYRFLILHGKLSYGKHRGIVHRADRVIHVPNKSAVQEQTASVGGRPVRPGT